MIHAQRTADPRRVDSPPAPTVHGRRQLMAARARAACITVRVVVPLTLVGLLVYRAQTTEYVGYHGDRDDCITAGYPTNVGSCMDTSRNE